jgi:hypothetical protein
VRSGRRALVVSGGCAWHGGGMGDVLRQWVDERGGKMGGMVKYHPRRAADGGRR